jgi:hypothetical protein
MAAGSFFSSARGGVGQLRVGAGEVALIGVARGHRKGEDPSGKLYAIPWTADSIVALHHWASYRTTGSG